MKMRSGNIIKLALFSAWCVNSLIIALVLYFNAHPEYLANHFISWLIIIMVTAACSIYGYDVWLKYQQKSVVKRRPNGHPV